MTRLHENDVRRRLCQIGLMLPVHLSQWRAIPTACPSGHVRWQIEDPPPIIDPKTSADSSNRVSLPVASLGTSWDRIGGGGHHRLPKVSVIVP
jgi:hypothetical protein